MSEKPPTQDAYASASHLTCQQVIDLIIDYVSEEMSAEAMERFEAHLRGCPDCIAFLNTYRGTIRATRSLRYEDIPGDMRSRVQQFLREKMQS